MRKLVLSLMPAVALILTGCNASSSSQDTGAASASTAASAVVVNSVSGTISLREPAQLSAKARMEIRLVDISATVQPGTTPLASKTVAPVGAFPMSFELTFNPTEVNPADLYVVKVQLVDGDRHYSMPLQAPVLTKGNKNAVTIQLVAEQTPAED
ncbi:MAG: YbaY family lipoprotein, partial [Rhodanobacter sp.]